MKYKFLDRANEPNKFGIETAILISGLAAAGATTAAGISAASASNNALSENLEENERNRKFNSEEAEKARKWQSSQWQNQYNQQKEEWYNQMNEMTEQYKQQTLFGNEEAFNQWMKQQEYNSPANMVSRLQAAGLNPSAAINAQQFGSTGLAAAPTSVGSPSVPSPSVALPASASVGLNNPAQASNSATAFGSVAEGLAKMIQSVGTFTKDSSEAGEIQTLLSAKFKKLLNDLDLQELDKSIKGIDLFIKSNSKDAQIQLFNQELQKKLSEIAVNWQNASYFAEKSASERLNQVVLDMAGKVKFEEFLQAQALTQRIGEIVDNRVNLGKEEIKTEKSKQSANYASASESKSHAALYDAQKLTEDLFRAPKKYALHLANALDEGRIHIQNIEEQIKANQFTESEARAAAAELQKIRVEDAKTSRQHHFNRLIDETLYLISSHFNLGISLSN